MKKCKGVTFFVRRTPLGDEVRRCEACGAEYIVRKTPEFSCDKLQAIARKTPPG